MHGRCSEWLLVLLLGVALAGGGCATEGKTNVWGQRWNVPYADNTVGAELGVWPRKGLDLYVQWVTPRLLSERLLPVADEAHRRRLSTFLVDYIVLRVVAVNHLSTRSHFFEYDRWGLLVGDQELRAVVPSGEKPTSEEGYFAGGVPPYGTLTGWLFFRRTEPGPTTVNLLYDFGYQRVTFGFPPIMRR